MLLLLEFQLLVALSVSMIPPVFVAMAGGWVVLQLYSVMVSSVVLVVADDSKVLAMCNKRDLWRCCCACGGGGGSLREEFVSKCQFRTEPQIMISADILHDQS